MRVRDLFEVTRGHGFDLVHLTEVIEGTGLAYVSRTDKNNGVLAWVKPVEGVDPAAAGTISVTLGGSILAAHVQPDPYYTAQNVDVLTPRDPSMSYAEKVWWARCIRANRYRYNYGRHANRTFREMELPDDVPTWVTSAPDAAIQEMLRTLTAIGESIEAARVIPNNRGDAPRVVTDLFDVIRGHGLDLTHLVSASPENGGIAYVSCTDADNGVSGWVAAIEGLEPASAGTISVALVGSTLAAYIQPRPYYTAQNVEVLTPRDRDMTFAEKAWWARCIRANRYRYNYGRKANRTFRTLRLPGAVPPWVTALPHEAIKEMTEHIEAVGQTLVESAGQGRGSSPCPQGFMGV